MSGHVHLRRSDVDARVAVVTLSYRAKFNAMSRAMWRELAEVFGRVQASDAWRCVLLQGEGGHFCAGGDIAEYPAFRFDTAQLRHFHEVEVWGALQALLDCDVPVVACIEGACMGAGVEIASGCDLRIAGSTARFGAPIARLGFPMAPREAQLVAGAVGEATARQMLLEAATFGAQQMLARGFLGRVVDGGGGALGADALATACRIAALAPGAARLNKQTLRALKVPPAQAGLAPEAIEKRANTVAAGCNPATDPYAYADSAEHREGIAAFLAKRPPVF